MVNNNVLLPTSIFPFVTKEHEETCVCKKCTRKETEMDNKVHIALHYSRSI